MDKAGEYIQQCQFVLLDRIQVVPQIQSSQSSSLTRIAGIDIVPDLYLDLI